MLRKFLVVLLAISVFLFMVVMPGIVFAGWSGSQTVTFEHIKGLDYLTIYTSVLDYTFNDYIATTIVMDVHPVKGADIDVSTTAYLPIRQLLYTTVGVRRSVYLSDTPLTPYLSLTYRF